MRLGTDVSGFDLDGPLPDIPDTYASKSGRQPWSTSPAGPG